MRYFEKRLTAVVCTRFGSNPTLKMFHAVAWLQFKSVKSNCRTELHSKLQLAGYWPAKHLGETSFGSNSAQNRLMKFTPTMLVDTVIGFLCNSR